MRRVQVHVELGSAMAGGATAGGVGGLFLGGVAGAVGVWLAGQVVAWQAQLGYSLGISAQLLPLGNTVGTLQEIADLWYLTIPAAALAVGVLGAAVGALGGGLWAALTWVGVGRLWAEVEEGEADGESQA